jgi:hypothetical protein
MARQSRDRKLSVRKAGVHRRSLGRALRVEALESRELLAVGFASPADAAIASMAHVDYGPACMAPAIGIGDQVQQRDQDRIQTPKRDGSCQTALLPS